MSWLEAVAKAVAQLGANVSWAVIKAAAKAIQKAAGG